MQSHYHTLGYLSSLFLVYFKITLDMYGTVNLYSFQGETKMETLTHSNLLTKLQVVTCYSFAGLTTLPKKGETITLRLDSKVYFTISNFGYRGTYGDKLYGCRHYTKQESR
jgi:hypothetical protein